MKGCLARDFTHRPPARLTTKIAITLRLILQLISIIEITLKDDPILLQFIVAALLFSFFFAVRPGDVLFPHGEQTGHKIITDMVCFIFDLEKRPIPITRPDLYPKDSRGGNIPPIYMTYMGDNSKNRKGNLAIRIVKVNPFLNEMCGVLFLFRFFLRFIPKSRTYLFSACPQPTNFYSDYNKLLKSAAKEMGLNEDYFLPHGVKAGLYEQLAQFSDDIKSIAGTHTLIGGSSGTLSKGIKKAYERMAPQWADLTARATHNLNTSPPAFLSYVHGSTEFGGEIFTTNTPRF